MAAQQAPCRQHRSAKRAMALNRFHGVFRTGGRESARRRKGGRYPLFVEPQAEEREGLRYRPSLFVFLLLHSHHFCVNFFVIASNARPTSSSTAENSTVRTDFFGLITTSMEPADASAERCSRTASRKRRLIRLRSTAPPSTRPTVKPMRADFA